MSTAQAHPLLQSFAFLEHEAGFTLTEFSDTPAAFDNCVAHYTRAAGHAPPLDVRIERDRGQVFVELRWNHGPWRDKESFLERLGIPRGRHPSDAFGAWTGYHLAAQAHDLRCHLPLLIQHLPEEPHTPHLRDFA